MKANLGIDSRTAASRSKTDGCATFRSRGPDARRRALRHAPAVETMEERVVMSGAGGGNLFGTLSYVGVMTSPLVAPQASATPVQQGSQAPQLGTDIQKLLNELQSLATKSGVTISDLESLTTDSQSLAQAGFRWNASTLAPVISELATAVAGSSSTSQAQRDFAALFSRTTVSTTEITTTFNDLIKTISDSAVTTSDLSTVAADEAAIQADFDNLPWFSELAADGLLNLQAGPSNDVSLTTAAFTLPTIVVGPNAIPIGLSGGSGLLASLSNAGVVTGTVISSQLPSSAGTTATAFAQLEADLHTLQAELQTLAAGSGVTISDLQSLAVDGQSIGQAGFFLNAQTLNPVISELATAVAAGASTAKAQQDFTTLFNGSNVSAAVITSTFNDLVKTIEDSHVTPANLATVASDRVAISRDIQNLHGGTKGGIHRFRPFPIRIVHPVRPHFGRILRHLR